MAILPIVEGQIIITLAGAEIKVDRVTAGVIAGVETQPLLDSSGDLTAALGVIQNAIFQAK